MRLWTVASSAVHRSTAVIWTYVPALVRSHSPGFRSVALIHASSSATQKGCRSVAVTSAVFEPLSPSVSTVTLTRCLTPLPRISAVTVSTLVSFVLGSVARTLSPTLTSLIALAEPSAMRTLVSGVKLLPILQLGASPPELESSLPDPLREPPDLFSALPPPFVPLDWAWVRALTWTELPLAPLEPVWAFFLAASAAALAAARALRLASAAAASAAFFALIKAALAAFAALMPISAAFLAARNAFTAPSVALKAPHIFLPLEKTAVHGMASIRRLPQAHRSPWEKQPTTSFQPMNSLNTAQPVARITSPMERFRVFWYSAILASSAAIEASKLDAEDVRPLGSACVTGLLLAYE
ncbi:hypothetical protein SAURM35S_00069 [Streptomyces aurantiogriseus]